MIVTLLARVGLSFLAPFVLPLLITAVIGGIGGTAWWNEWLDVPTTLILIAGATLVYLYSATDSTVLRFIIVAALVGLGYVHGRFDESEHTQARIAEAVAEVHAKYTAETEKEKARQEKVAAETKAEADQLKAKRLIEVTTLRSKLQALRKEADNAPKAQEPAFDLDAVDRLNRLRH